MKKRLLITSIVMMLVVALALSTATYAWFTSNATVTANQVILTAQSADGDAILISRAADNSGLGSEITLTAQGSSKLYPATPLATTAFDAAGSISQSNFQNLLMGGSGTYTVPANLGENGVSFYKDTFYVYNKGTKNVTLAPTIKIYYDERTTSTRAAQSVRIALIERVGTAVTTSNVDFTSASYSLKGIYQYNTTPAKTTSVFAAAPDDFQEGQVYYSSNEGEGTVASGITSENYAASKSGLYVKKFTNETASGANATYGVTEVTTTDPYSYTPGTVDFTSKVAAMAAIGTPLSGYYVANEYTVVVWLEGWDPDCTNAITAGVFSVDVHFAVAA